MDSVKHFNSTKVQFGVGRRFVALEGISDFNSTKVQFGAVAVPVPQPAKTISIPLRYNLEP